MTSDWCHLFAFMQENRGRTLALATLIKSEGSSYRQPGARLLINEEGRFKGSLSGGCLEQGIAQVAQKVLQDGCVRIEKINTEPHFGCPGILMIQVERLPAFGLLDDIVAKIMQRESFVLTTDREKTYLGRGDGLLEEVEARPRLLVVGGTSDHEPLFRMARELHWECCRIVPDGRVLEGLPVVAGERQSNCPASELQKRFQADSSTALLIMSHHLVTDLAYLKAGVEGGYRYLGLLGSQRRRQTLLNELGECGLLEDERWLANFYGPIGLDLGANHPTTIALAILAEVQAVLSGGAATFLREQAGRIHLKLTS